MESPPGGRGAYSWDNPPCWSPTNKCGAGNACPWCGDNAITRAHWQAKKAEMEKKAAERAVLEWESMGPNMRSWNAEVTAALEARKIKNAEAKKTRALEWEKKEAAENAEDEKKAVLMAKTIKQFEAQNARLLKWEKKKGGCEG